MKYCDIFQVDQPPLRENHIGGLGKVDERKKSSATYLIRITNHIFCYQNHGLN